MAAGYLTQTKNELNKWWSVANDENTIRGYVSNVKKRKRVYQMILCNKNTLSTTLQVPVS